MNSDVTSLTMDSSSEKATIALRWTVQLLDPSHPHLEEFLRVSGCNRPYSIEIS